MLRRAAQCRERVPQDSRTSTKPRLSAATAAVVVPYAEQVMSCISLKCFSTMLLLPINPAPNRDPAWHHTNGYPSHD